MPSSFTLLKKSFAIFSENPKRYVILVAAPAVLTFIAAFFEPNINNPEPDITLLVLYGFLTLVSLVVSIFMTIAIVYAVADQSLSVKDAYKKAQSQFFKYIVLVVGMIALLLFAFLLLIIPGIWLSVSFSFAIYFLLLKGDGVKQALSSSMALVKGRWWVVATKLFVLTLVYILLFFVIEFISGFLGGLFRIESLAYAFSSTLGLFITPFGMIYTYELFSSLQSNVTPVISEVVTTSSEAAV